MASTNYKPRVAIVYASATGNTKAAAEILQHICHETQVPVSIFAINDFPLAELSRYDVVVVGTYTWGSGEIPKELRGLFTAFEELGHKKLVTAVFGTGDSCYAEFCGAVDRFRDMLFVHTELAATLKVELMPQDLDYPRFEKLAASIEAAWQNVMLAATN
ncbi:flavodoxin domain-containing protein [Planococcus koreensis]|uniref:flavodoxin domain-containing protein n=1 Tax=Planococcus koreensis TaxID=112331 RepID=UPI0039FC95C6